MNSCSAHNYFGLKLKVTTNRGKRSSPCDLAPLWNAASGMGFTGLANDEVFMCFVFLVQSYAHFCLEFLEVRSVRWDHWPNLLVVFNSVCFQNGTDHPQVLVLPGQKPEC